MFFLLLLAKFFFFKYHSFAPVRVYSSGATLAYEDTSSVGPAPIGSGGARSPAYSCAPRARAAECPAAPPFADRPAAAGAAAGSALATPASRGQSLQKYNKLQSLDHS